MVGIGLFNRLYQHEQQRPEYDEPKQVGFADMLIRQMDSRDEIREFPQSPGHEKSAGKRDDVQWDLEGGDDDLLSLHYWCLRVLPQYSPGGTSRK